MGSTIIKEYQKKFTPDSTGQLFKDLAGGIITALVSIPISMGYAQIAGLPMQYGLYGSVFTIIIFGLLTTSREFVFGVDAAPAALIGGIISSMGIAAGSEEAMTVVPTLTFFVSFWLLIFYIFKAGRIVKYISSSVMGGFVTGICCTIILMQTPKLFGGNTGTGEAPELIYHIISQLTNWNPVSAVLSAVSVIIIMLGKKLIPKVPVSVIVMAGGAAAGLLLPLDSYGVKMLPDASSGFPWTITLPAVSSVKQISEYLFSSLSVAAVILSESLLASRGNAMKDGYKLNSNREILAYTAANFMAAVSGCCPVNASVSRTGIMRQFGAKSQWLSISAGLSMLAVLYFAAPIIKFMPVPVLTSIVVCALINACEWKEAKHFFKRSKPEFYIFIGAWLAVLVFGTVYGVIIGIVLSFVSVIIRAVTPPRDFLGVIKGKDDSFYSLRRNNEAKPIKNTLIYRFGGNLFFANIDTLQNDIDSAVKEDTKVIIINAGACGNIDITAAERLLMMYENYKKRNVSFYITEHIGEVNDLLRSYGTDKLLESGAVRMTTPLALRDAGIPSPYPLENTGDFDFPGIKLKIKSRSGSTRKNEYIVRPKHISRKAKGLQPELEWVFGDQAKTYKDRIADELVEKLFDKDVTQKELEEAEKHTFWGRVNMFDEEDILDRIEQKLKKELKSDPERLEKLNEIVENRRHYIEKRMQDIDPAALSRLKARREKFITKDSSKT